MAPVKPRLSPAAVSVLLALGAVVAAALVKPSHDDPNLLTLFGYPFGGGCVLRNLTGLPCPSCGMTRAWVYSVRGELEMALRYNAVGVLLLGGLVVNGFVHAVGLHRPIGALLARAPRRLNLFLLVAGLGFVGAWAFTWFLRLAGYYPLP
jgi:hypothetical protein